MPDTDLNEEPRVEWSLFAGALIVLLVVCAPLFGFPEASAQRIKALYQAITTNFGFLYLWCGIAVLAFCVWIVSSRHGRVKLGAANETPQFSTYSWVSMLFCAGVATGILYWGSIEWTYYYVSPPYGAEPRSVEAIEWASTYGIFHWGPTGWAFYCIPALAIGHAYYCRGIPRMRVSTACHAVLKHQTDGPIGKVFDLCFMIGLLGAAGTSLGFGTPMIAAGISEIFGVEPSYK
ncbi:MAG: BCCT family transporter, partial [Bythopirellula sp.]